MRVNVVAVGLPIEASKLASSDSCSNVPFIHSPLTSFRTEFCWLCGAVLGLHGMSHFFGLKGCTMYGKKRWSLDRIRRHRRWSPVAYPAAVVAAAVVTPLAYLALPVALGMEESRACKTSGVSRGKR
jgi:hypothetical protein